MINPMNKSYNHPATPKFVSSKANLNTTNGTQLKKTTSNMQTDNIKYSPAKDNSQTSSLSGGTSTVAEGSLESMITIRNEMNVPESREGTSSDKLQDRLNNIKSNPNASLYQAYSNKQNVINLLA